MTPRRTIPSTLLLALAVLLAGSRESAAIQLLLVDSVQVSFPSPTPSDFDAGGLEKLSANTLTVESDVDWKLTVAGTSATWACSGAKCWTAKPRSDIRWRETGSSYAPLSGTASVVTTGAATIPGTEDVVVDYRVLLDWTADSPGTYDYDHVRYEVSAL